MKCVLLMNESDATLAERADPATAPAYRAAWSAYVRAIEATGMVTGGAGLQGHETTAVLRVRDGARQVQDGPFADSRERVGGFFVIDAPDLDTALACADRAPDAARRLRPRRRPARGRRHAPLPHRAGGPDMTPPCSLLAATLRRA